MSYTQGPWPTWAYGEVSDNYSGYQQYSNNYSAYLADSMEAYQTQHHHLVHHHQMSRTTESKPRLSKDEVEVLEAEFQKNHKPNSSTKKALAESMRVDNARINNWFQNRRAREKKERNIREYEARQKLEKEKNEGKGSHAKFPDPKSDLVASSAPFPNSTRGDKREASSGPGLDSDATTPCFSDENSEVKLEKPSQLPSGLFSYSETDTGTSTFSNGGDCTSPSNGTSEANEHDLALSTDEEDPEYFVKQVRQAMGETSNPLYDYEGEAVMDFSSTHSADDESTLRSPPSIDIASRRNNRRPPPLSIGGSRSHSSGIPKTAIEMGKRTDPMRRVASATGTMRVSKPMGVPRSPFQMNRSPVLAGVKGSHAPPTPDTPILANQPATADGVNVLNSTSALSTSDLAVRDPTLRTPPTTPGGVHNFFNLNSIYDMSIVGDGFVTPSMANYAGGFQTPHMSMAYQSHFTGANSCGSQPQTPSFVSPMSSSNYGLVGGSAEYTWPETVISRNPSPAEQPHSHFLNVPASGFNMMER